MKWHLQRRRLRTSILAHALPTGLLDVAACRNLSESAGCGDVAVVLVSATFAASRFACVALVAFAVLVVSSSLESPPSELLEFSSSSDTLAEELCELEALS